MKIAFPTPGCLAEWRAGLPPRRDRWIGALAALTVISTLWNVAGMGAEPVLVSCVFALLTFAAMFFPMFDADSPVSARENLKKLLRFPLFWIGLALFSLMLFQHLNPSRAAELSAGGGWRILYFPDHIAWAPNGISAPFGFDGNRLGMNALRQMCVFGGAWLLLCALWCGLRSRRVRTWLMWTLVLNSALLAVFCLLRWSNNLNTEYLGWKTGTASFFGVFSYKNHAAEFFVLSFAVAVALALNVWRGNVEKFKKSGAHVLLATLSLFLWIAALCTASFAGIVLAAAWLPIVPALIFSSGLVKRSAWIALGIVSAMILGLAAVWFATADMHATWNKIEAKFALIKKEEIDDRKAQRELAWTMFTRNETRERFGWGAGSFRWIAPNFQRQMPAFLSRDGKRLAVRSEYAHCDPLQMLAEWGIVGAGIFAAGTLWFFAFALINIRRWRVSTFALMTGTTFFLAHSTMDFVSYNPALLLTLAAAVAAVRWTFAPRNF